MVALKQLKLAKNGYIIMSVLFMVLGACLIIWPDCSMAVFCTAVGIMLIVYGLIKILGYFSRDIYCLAFQFDLAFGVLLAAVGIIIIVRRHVVVNLIFGIFGLLILADAGAVGRDGKNVQLVNIMEFRSFRFRRAGHARQFFVQAEVVLDGDGRVRLVFPLHFHAFLGFHRLVQTVAPAASRHFTARILVDDDDLAFLDDVFHVFFVNAVGLQQLGGGVQARSRFVKLFGQFIFAAQFVFFRQARIFVHFRKGGSQIRQHEIFRMAGRDDFPAFFHQVGVVGFSSTVKNISSFSL